MKLKIFTDQDEEELKVLNTISEPVDDIQDVQDLVTSLRDYLVNNLDAVGIAAPQIGHNKMIFAMVDPNSINRNVTVCINPEIIKLYDNKTGIYKEGCLSVPDRQITTRRYKMLKVAYFDETGKRHKRTLKNLEAVIFQHELDHLFGVLMTNKSLINESEEETNE